MLGSEPRGPCACVGAVELKIRRVAVFAPYLGLLFCTELTQLHQAKVGCSIWLLDDPDN